MSSQWISANSPEADERMKDSLRIDERQEEQIRLDYIGVRARIARDAQRGYFNLGHAEERIERYSPGPRHPDRLVCERCGWWLNYITHGAHDEPTALACLRRFRIDDERLAIEEIRSHLSKRFSDVHSLPSRRFEELVSDVFSSLGYETELTKRTRDGGVDIICLKKASGETAIVECKRYAESQRVGIGVVHRLVGAMFHFEAKTAHIVTTSSFTKPARDSADKLNKQNLSVNLVDGHELFKLLNCYSDPTITVKDVGAIFRSTQRK